MTQTRVHRYKDHSETVSWMGDQYVSCSKAEGGEEVRDKQPWFD